MVTSSVRNKFPQKTEDINTGIGPIADKILNIFLDRLTTPEFREKITDKLINPATSLIIQKIKPYIYISILLYVILLILLLIIMILLVSVLKKTKNI